MTRKSYLKKEISSDGKEGDENDLKEKDFDVLGYLKYKNKITSNDIENLIINDIDLYPEYM